MKALKKEEIFYDDIMEQVKIERNVLALGSSFPYLTQLHSAFDTSVSATFQKLVGKTSISIYSLRSWFYWGDPSFFTLFQFSL